MKRDLYATFLMILVDMLTAQGVRPELLFDAEKECPQDVVVQQWSRDAFRSSKLNLLYALIARGIDIPEPVHVKPASRPLLEVADVVGYLIARYLMQVREGRIPEFDLSRLGEIFFVAFDSACTHVNHVSSVGYPWLEDYKMPASRWRSLSPRAQ